MESPSLRRVSITRSHQFGRALHSLKICSKYRRTNCPSPFAYLLPQYPGLSKSNHWVQNGLYNPPATGGSEAKCLLLYRNLERAPGMPRSCLVKALSIRDLP